MNLAGVPVAEFAGAFLGAFIARKVSAWKLGRIARRVARITAREAVEHHESKLHRGGGVTVTADLAQ